VVPEPDEVRAILATLIADWRVPVPSIEVAARDNILVGLTIYGLTAHTYTLAEAVVTLYDSGQHVAAVPLIRHAIECTMTAVWVELAGHAAALALVQEQNRNIRNAFATFTAAGMQPDDEAARQLAEDALRMLKTATPAGKYFEQRCKEIEGGIVMYGAYRSASQVSHASASVVDLYLEGADIEGVSPTGMKLLNRPQEFSPDSWLGTLLSMVIQATSVWSRIDRGHTARTAMKALNRRLGTQYKQTYSAQGLRGDRVRAQELRAWRATERPGPSS
jgi:hypothetical protein